MIFALDDIKVGHSIISIHNNRQNETKRTDPEICFHAWGLVAFVTLNDSLIGYAMMSDATDPATSVSRISRPP